MGNIAKNHHSKFELNATRNDGDLSFFKERHPLATATTTTTATTKTTTTTTTATTETATATTTTTTTFYSLK